LGKLALSIAIGEIDGIVGPRTPSCYDRGHPHVAWLLDRFLHHHHAQGLSARRLEPAELFHPSTLESHKL
jgi:hypothetical protein